MAAYAAWKKRQREQYDRLHCFDGGSVDGVPSFDFYSLDHTDYQEYKHTQAYSTKRLEYPQVFTENRLKRVNIKYRFTAKLMERLIQSDERVYKRLSAPNIDRNQWYHTDAIILQPSPFDFEDMIIILQDGLIVNDCKLIRLNLPNVPIIFEEFTNPLINVNLPTLFTIKCKLMRSDRMIYGNLPYLLSTTIGVFIDERIEPVLSVNQLDYQYNLPKTETFKCALSTQSLPGTVIVYDNVLSRFPRILSILHSHGHSIHDRPSYSTPIAWLYTPNHRFILCNGKVELPDQIDNVHLILLGDCEVGRGQWSQLACKQNTTVHYCASDADAVSVIESFGMDTVIMLPDWEETAWERFDFFFDLHNFTPFKY